MPSRVICGEAVWRSKKLKNIPPKYRSYFALLIPLAEANGVFEADTNRVWSDVFSYNMDFVTLEDVERILECYENAGMLIRWEQDNKTYGYWVGIDKPGRLPPKSRISKYAYLPPNPPEELLRGNMGVNLLKRIKWACKDHDLNPENESYYKKYLNELGDRFGRQEVLDAFIDWASDLSNPVKNPISRFIELAEDLLKNTKEQSTQINSLVLDKLCATLYTLGEQVFSGKYKQSLGELLSQFSSEEIISAYKEFIRNKDSFDMKYAANNFTQGGALAIIMATRERQEKILNQQKILEQETAKHKEEVSKNVEEEIIEEL